MWKVKRHNALKAVAETMIQEYPDVIYGYSNLGVFYLANKEYDLGLKVHAIMFKSLFYPHKSIFDDQPITKN